MFLLSFFAAGNIDIVSAPLFDDGAIARDIVGHLDLATFPCSYPVGGQLLDSFPGGDLEEIPETEERADGVPRTATSILVILSGTRWTRSVSNVLRQWKPNFINYQICYRTLRLRHYFFGEYLGRASNRSSNPAEESSTRTGVSFQIRHGSQMIFAQSLTCMVQVTVRNRRRHWRHLQKHLATYRCTIFA